jgi:hypothetical protein
MAIGNANDNRKQTRRILHWRKTNADESMSLMVFILDVDAPKRFRRASCNMQAGVVDASCRKTCQFVLKPLVGLLAVYESQTCKRKNHLIAKRNHLDRVIGNECVSTEVR